MANDFKSNSKANIAIDSGTYSTIYTVPYTATPVESILLEVDIANTYSSDITVDVKINKNSGGTGGTDDIFLVLNCVGCFNPAFSAYARSSSGGFILRSCKFTFSVNLLYTL